jgi:hypothetical protein
MAYLARKAKFEHTVLFSTVSTPTDYLETVASFAVIANAGGVLRDCSGVYAPPRHRL